MTWTHRGRGYVSATGTLRGRTDHGRPRARPPLFYTTVTSARSARRGSCRCARPAARAPARFLDVLDGVDRLDGRRQDSLRDLLAEVGVDGADLLERAGGEPAAEDEADQRLAARRSARCGTSPGRRRSSSRSCRRRRPRRRRREPRRRLARTPRRARGGSARRAVAPSRASARSGPSTTQASAPSAFSSPNSDSRRTTFTVLMPREPGQPDHEAADGGVGDVLDDPVARLRGRRCR